MPAFDTGLAEPTKQSSLAWTALGLSVGMLLLVLAGAPAILLAAPVGAAGFIVSIIAVRKRAQPRWAAMLALITCSVAALIALAIVGVATFIMVSYSLSV